jgi:hypothetical protein
MKEINNTYSCFIPALDASDIGISANLRSEKWRPMVAIGGGIADLSTGDNSSVAPGFEAGFVAVAPFTLPLENPLITPIDPSKGASWTSG